MKIKISLLLLIIAIIIIGAGTVFFSQRLKTENKPETKTETTSSQETQQKTPEINNIEYPNASVFYESGDQIWQFNQKTGEKKKIANGIRPQISPDKNKISYTYQNINKYFKQSEAPLIGIHIFDIATGEDTVLKKYDLDYPVWETAWSPDGKYLVVDTGTSPIRNKTVISSTTGKEIVSFKTVSQPYSESYAWINDQEIVFCDLQDVSESRPYESGQGSGIAIVNLSGQKRILKTATDKKDYRFLRLLDGKIYFSLRTVKSNDNWTDDTKQTVSYWTMDKLGGNLVQVEKTEELENKIKKILPSPYNEYRSLWNVTLLTSNPDWAVFVLNKKGETQLEDEVFMMDIKNPESIKKISDGTYPSW